MEVMVTMYFTVENNEDFQEVKTIEHHAERLLDLDNWPEIKSVYGVRVEPITKEDAEAHNNG